jgi:hypothetical protein
VQAESQRQEDNNRQNTAPLLLKCQKAQRVSSAARCGWPRLCQARRQRYLDTNTARRQEVDTVFRLLQATCGLWSANRDQQRDWATKWLLLPIRASCLSGHRRGMAGCGGSRGRELSQACLTCERTPCARRKKSAGGPFCCLAQLLLHSHGHPASAHRPAILNRVTTDELSHLDHRPATTRADPRATRSKLSTAAAKRAPLLQLQIAPATLAKLRKAKRAATSARRDPERPSVCSPPRAQRRPASSTSTADTLAAPRAAEQGSRTRIIYIDPNPTTRSNPQWLPPRPSL